MYEGRNRAGRILKSEEVIRGGKYVRESVCVCMWGRVTTAGIAEPQSKGSGGKGQKKEKDF